MLAALDRARLVQPATQRTARMSPQQRFTLWLTGILCLFALCLAAGFMPTNHC